jgi:hypothetical protein
MKETPNNITKLKDNEIFIFGSNISGRHGKGAALSALKWGARYGKGIGLSGKTYAIPTKDSNLKTLSIEEIKKYVDSFINFTKDNPQYIFLVTEIGCGLAGYKPKDVAPLFKAALDLKNIYLQKNEKKDSLL